MRAEESNSGDKNKALKDSEAEDLKKLWQQHLKQKEFTSLKNWQNQNQWLKNNLFKYSVISTRRNIRWYNVNLIHKWSAIEDCTIVLLLLKMVEWYFKLQGSGIGFLYQRRQYTAIKLYEQIPAGTISLCNGHHSPL